MSGALNGGSIPALACVGAMLVGCGSASTSAAPIAHDDAVAAAPEAAMRRELAAAVPCFEAGLLDDEGAPVTCELSGAAAVGHELIVFNDKPVPGPDRSAVFWLDEAVTSASARYIREPVFAAFRKYEDAEPWPGGGVLVTTGFDRVADDAHWDGFNALFLWRPDAPAKIIGSTTRDGVTSSLALRQRFAAALADARFPDGPPYFKIEGLAALPDGRVLFGVREIGRSYEDFEYTVTILVARDLDAIARDGLRVGWTFDARGDARITVPIGVSGLTWDDARGRLWMTTSWETGETETDLGGHLWWLSCEDLDEDGTPHLVHDTDGQPWVFAHKPEAITVLADGRLLVVHDDDRITFAPADTVGRALHESVFEVLAPQ